MSSEIRKSNFKLLVSTFAFILFSSGPVHAETFPSKEISLADWGLKNPSEIGYASIGVLHKKEGDALIIYDIRKQRPVVKEPKRPRGRTPSFKGDVFLVSHFNQGNVNRLGGYFNGFAKIPSQSSVAIKKTPDGVSALAYSYANVTPGFSGFWIHLFNFKTSPAERVFLDATPFKYLTFSIRGAKGGGKLLLQIADRAWEKNEDSLKVGDVISFLPSVKIERSWQQAWVPLSKLPRGLDRKELASIVFKAQGNRCGRIFVKDLAFTKKRDVQIPSAKAKKVFPRSLSKAMWLWETEKISKNHEEQKRLLTFCKTQGITDLFVQIPYKAAKENGKWKILWDSSKIKPLISKLRKIGVQVHALDGDPRFPLKEWHGRVTALIERIIKYNKKASPQERFIGIRYDNEPYLLPHFGGIQKEHILKQYLEWLEKSHALARKAGLSFGVDIPFWFDGLNEFFEPAAAFEGRPVSDRIIDIVDNIGIMDYRTLAYGADGTIVHATDALEYAAKRGKTVFVGLETVWLPNETIFEFGPKGSGSRLLIEKIEGSKVRLTWSPEGKQVASKGAFLLRQTRSVQVPSSKLTFNQKKLKDLEETMRQTEEELRQFPSFRGFVIHSYESYRSWLDRQRGER